MSQKLFKFMEVKPELLLRLTGCFGFPTLQNARLPSSVELVILQHGHGGREERKRRERKRGGGPPVPGSEPPVCMQEDTVTPQDTMDLEFKVNLKK